MTLKFGILMLFAASTAAMSAQTPTVVQDIYASNGETTLKDGASVVYSVGSWHSPEDAQNVPNSSVSLWGAMFDQLVEQSASGIDAIFADVEGVALSWNGDDKVLTVVCPDDKVGRAALLISDLNGASRGVQTITESPAKISLPFAQGTYVVGVAMDGKLVKSLKIILK